jgi:hypothetical protein
MTRKPDHLNGCLERFLQNERLKDQPGDTEDEEAGEIRRLLKTAGALKRYSENVEPRREFVIRMQAKLATARALKEKSRKSIAVRLFEPLGRWAIPATIAVTMTVLTSTGGFVLAESASKNAEPGETLYPVKLATERIKANLPASDNEKGRYLVQQTNISTDETINAAGGADSVGTETISGTPERYLAETGNPGKSGQAPGQQPALLSAASFSLSEGGNPGKSGAPPSLVEANMSAGGDDNPGKSDPPGQQPPAAGDTNPGNGNSGKSDQAPGQHPPASGDTGSGGSGNSGKSDQAPGQQPPASGDTGSGGSGNSGNSDQAPDQQPPAAGETNPGNGDSGKSGEAPGQQPSTPGNTNVPERGKSGK